MNKEIGLFDTGYKYGFLCYPEDCGEDLQEVLKKVLTDDSAGFNLHIKDNDLQNSSLEYLIH